MLWLNVEPRRIFGRVEGGCGQKRGPACWWGCRSRSSPQRCLRSRSCN